jgi:hypothetical protein
MSSSPEPDFDRSMCPSAPAWSEGAEVFGVVLGTAAAPRVQYLDAPVPVTAELLQTLGDSRPGEVLRVRSPCAKSACVHYSGQHCRLGERIVALPHEGDTRLPACSIRPSCRWFAEQGKRACLRCPELATEVVAPLERLDTRVRLPLLVDAPKQIWRY